MVILLHSSALHAHRCETYAVCSEPTIVSEKMIDGEGSVCFTLPYTSYEGKTILWLRCRALQRIKVIELTDLRVSHGQQQQHTRISYTVSMPTSTSSSISSSPAAHFCSSGKKTTRMATVTKKPQNCPHCPFVWQNLIAVAASRLWQCSGGLRMPQKVWATLPSPHRPSP